VTALSQPEPAKQKLSLPDLALTFLKIGAIGFGGGMAIIALMERELVRRRRAIDEEEFLHGVGLGQLLGPFAVNTALFAGYRLYGTIGGLISASVFMAPSLVLVLVLSWLYFSYHAIPALQGAVAGLAPVVIALIWSAAWSMRKSALRSWLTVLMCGVATIVGLYKVNPVYVLVAAGTIGLALGTRLGINDASPVSREQTASDVRTQLGAGIFFWPLSLPAAPGTVSLVQLSFTFFAIGLVFFGGGFVLIPVLHQNLVVSLGWLSPQEFIDGVAISNLTPGPISVLATFAGYRLRGITGALAATVALYLPAVIVMLTLCRQYERLRGHKLVQSFLAGVAPAVIGLVLSTGLQLAAGTLHSWRAFVFAALALLLLIRWKWQPGLILVLGAMAGAAGVLP
jgi:chromate transporter